MRFTLHKHRLKKEVNFVEDSNVKETVSGVNPLLAFFPPLSVKH